MTALFQIPSNFRVILMILLYSFLLLQMGCLLAALTGTEKYLVWQIVPLFLVSFLELILIRSVNEWMQLKEENIPQSVRKWMYQFPAEAAVFLVLILGIFTCYFLVKTVHRYQNFITGSSIKESIDNLPAGLSFSAPNGRILLANRRMETLCHSIAGTDLQDAERFWGILSHGSASEEKIPPHGSACKKTERISYGDTPSFRLMDGTIWTFEKKSLNADGTSVVQITAIDTTELYRLSENLQENNRQLTQMNIRLKQYGENIEAFVRNREILGAKMRIHNEMGQALLASRSCLIQETSPLHEKDILKQWKYVISLLKKETDPRDSKGTWKYFVDAANFAGVQIVLDGKIPKKEETVKLIVAAAAEALTNAVRHAGADELYLKLREEQHMMKITFTNNGRNPEEEITEGGGLESLRIRLEEAGGTMRTEVQPRFALIVTVPAGREEKDDKCFDRGR